MELRCTALLPALAALAAGAGLGCTTTVLPPLDPPAPTSVFLVDHGRHSSLLLPDAGGASLTEYAYGDWGWFALDRTGFLRVFPTLFWPTPGALGRRTLDVEPDAEAVRPRVASAELHELVVAAEDAQALAARLGAEFEAGLDSLHHQPLYALDFVHAPRRFHLFHNCNHAVRAWLRELGCEVRGGGLLSGFTVQPARRR